MRPAATAEARDRGELEPTMVSSDVPLHVVSSRGRAERQHLADIAMLMRVLLQEEQQALRAALTDAADRSGTWRAVCAFSM